MKKVIILHHTEMGDCINMNGLVNYFSKLYNEIIIFCQDVYVNNVKILYEQNNKINVLSLNNRITNYNFTTLNKLYNNDIDEIKKNITIYAQQNHYEMICCGEWFKNRNIYKNLPYDFYDDAMIQRNIFWTNSYIPKTPGAINLYNEIKNNKYIFIHVKIFNDHVLKLIKNLKINFLVLNPNFELYEKGTIQNNIERCIINKPIFDYTTIMENAHKIFLCDSSFFCLAQHLNIKTDMCYYIKFYDKSVNYEDYLWSIQNGYNEHGKIKKFKRLQILE
jgi:hypothetical protein